MVREFWLALQNREMSSCCMAFFIVLSCHTCSVQSVCAHAGNDLTQKLLVKKQHRLRSQSPQSGSSTPECLNTVLGNTCRCRSHTPLLAQCLEFCGGIVACWADAAPVECAWDHGPHPLVLPAKYSLSFWLCSMAKTSRPPGASVKKEQVLLTLLAAKNCQCTFHLYFQQYFPCNSSGCTARLCVAQTVSCCLKLAWQKD